MEAEILGGAQDGDVIKLRPLLGMLSDGEWHLYEDLRGDGRTLIYAGVLRPPSALPPTDYRQAPCS